MQHIDAPRRTSRSAPVARRICTSGMLFASVARFAKATFDLHPMTEIAILPENEAPLVRLRRVVKRYPGVLAVDDVSLDVGRGEIHAVLGENGAGKSTLMKIIYGVVQPDAGTIDIDGYLKSFATPGDARACGIGMVFQHFALFESTTVVENVAVAMPGRPRLRELAAKIAEVSSRYRLPIDPWRPVHQLSVGERQRVEVMRALLQRPRVLIMDEPTSVLTPQAIEQLFDTLRLLAREGTAILYVSHKLDEIRALCERVTILREGKVVAVLDPRLETEASLAEHMLGGQFPECRRKAHVLREVRLEAVGLTLAADDEGQGTTLDDIRFQVRSGEIVGIAGISGNGQSELLAALSGERPIADAKAIRLEDAPIGHESAGRRRARGLAYVPDDRLGVGVVPAMSLTRNAVLTAHHAGGMVRSGWLDFAAARRYAMQCIDAFKVRCRGPEAPARSLSGGNLQKFIVGRELMQAPRVAIFAQPSLGLDVAATAAIRQAIIDLAASGAAALVVSEDLAEILEVCDRVAVLAGGRLSPAIEVEAINAAEIGRWMAGLFSGNDVDVAARVAESVRAIDAAKAGEGRRASP